MERKHGAGNVAIAILLSLIFPAVYLLSQLFVSLLAGLVILIGALFNNRTPELSGDLLLVLTVISGVTAAVAAILTIKLRRQNIRTELRLRNPGGGTIAISLLLGVILNIASLLIMAVLPIPDWMLDSYNEQVSSVLLDGSSPVLMVISVGLLVPIVEEICLRAMPLRALRRAIPVAVSAVIGGAIFALIHGNPLQMLYVLPVGVILCFVYIWTESIYSTIALHVGYNGFSAILSVLPLAAEAGDAAEEPLTAVTVVLAAIFTAISALLIWAIYRHRVMLVPIGNVSEEVSSNNDVLY